MDTIKLKDIADQLGLSVSTVSRAMSGMGRVGAKTRERVLAACEDADYRPNAVARSLRLRDAKNVGVIVPDIANPYYASVLKGAQGVCRANGYTLMVCNSDENPEFEREALQTLLEKQVSGLIVASVGESGELFRHYRRLGLPIVCFDNIAHLADQSEQMDFVSIDNHKAAYDLTAALIDRGYDRLGMIAGPLRQSTGHMRLSGFKQALTDRGLPVRDSWIKEGDFKMPSGEQAMREILALPDQPRAMLISNNDMAYGAIKAMRAANMRIPDDMAVAAFDALDSTEMIRPRISSINQPAEEIGLQCARIVMDRIARKEPMGRALSITLKPVFFDGDSW